MLDFLQVQQLGTLLILVRFFSLHLFLNQSLHKPNILPAVPNVYWSVPPPSHGQFFANPQSSHSIRYWNNLVIRDELVRFIFATFHVFVWCRWGLFFRLIIVGLWLCVWRLKLIRTCLIFSIIFGLLSVVTYVIGTIHELDNIAVFSWRGWFYRDFFWSLNLFCSRRATKFWGYRSHLLNLNICP